MRVYAKEPKAKTLVNCNGFMAVVPFFALLFLKAGGGEMEREAGQKRWVYQSIFWDRPEVARMSPEELKKYLEKSRGDRFSYDTVLRRFIERGSLTEAVQFFPLEEIERGLNTFRFWQNVPEWRLSAWRRAINKLIQRMGKAQL